MQKDLVKANIETLLSLAGINFDQVELIFDENIKNTRFVIKTDEPFMLIGKDGEILASLNHIVRQITFNNINQEEVFEPFTIDVNNYKAKKEAELKTKALMLAERARFFKSNIEMSPMNPYERMVVHSIFAETPDIETESVGIGKTRRVIIKYATSHSNEV